MPDDGPVTGDLRQLASGVIFDVYHLRRIEQLLEDKKQIIFQGPPGTGKTYAARMIARHFAGTNDRVTLVQFHPSYAYEDFVQGFRRYSRALSRASSCARPRVQDVPHQTRNARFPVDLA